jgi:hypothetical protein
MVGLPQAATTGSTGMQKLGTIFVAGVLSTSSVIYVAAADLNAPLQIVLLSGRNSLAVPAPPPTVSRQFHSCSRDVSWTRRTRTTNG